MRQELRSDSVAKRLARYLPASNLFATCGRDFLANYVSARRTWWHGQTSKTMLFASRSGGCRSQGIRSIRSNQWRSGICTNLRCTTVRRLHVRHLDACSFEEPHKHKPTTNQTSLSTVSVERATVAILSSHTKPFGTLRVGLLGKNPKQHDEVMQNEEDGLLYDTTWTPTTNNRSNEIASRENSIPPSPTGSRIPHS